MRDCDKYVEMISAMVDGELSAEQETELRTHIDTCGECAKIYDAFMGISDVLGDDLIAPPETLAKGIMYKINLQKKRGAGRHFAFGRYTAIAACLALALFSASHFGLLDGLKLGSAAPTQSLRMADEDGVAMEAAPAAEPAGDSADTDMTGSSLKENDSQTVLTAGMPAVQDSEGTVVQFGFSEDTMTAAAQNGSGDDKEPTFLFEAKEIRVFEGEFYLEEEKQAENKLLFTLSTKEELDAAVKFLTALPDESAEYSPEDVKIMDSEPLFTLYVPVDKEKDPDEKDKLINVWFVEGKLWCVISDAEIPEPGVDVYSQKILYKAEGLQEKFEAFITEIGKANSIT